MAQAPADVWQSPYVFKADGKTIVLQHHLEQNLRTAPGKGAGAVRSNGGFGKFARWVVNIKDGNATFKNEKTDEYLRIHKDTLDAAGKGGKFCWFKVHRLSQRVSKFESVEHPGSWVAVDKDGNPKIGKGGRFCRFDCLKEGAPAKFSLPYGFKKVKRVIIEHRDHKNVRTGAEGNVETNGGKGEWAQWEATPDDGGKTVQFKNVKTGDWLRIMGNGDVDAKGKGKGLTIFKVHQVGAKNEVRLESHKHNGVFLSLKPQAHKMGSDDGKNRKSIFNLFRDD